MPIITSTPSPTPSSRLALQTQGPLPLHNRAAAAVEPTIAIQTLVRPSTTLLLTITVPGATSATSGANSHVDGVAVVPAPASSYIKSSGGLPPSQTGAVLGAVFGAVALGLLAWCCCFFCGTRRVHVAQWFANGRSGAVWKGRTGGGGGGGGGTWWTLGWLRSGGGGGGRGSGGSRSSGNSGSSSGSSADKASLADSSSDDIDRRRGGPRSSQPRRGSIPGRPGRGAGANAGGPPAGRGPGGGGPDPRPPYDPRYPQIPGGPEVAYTRYTVPQPRPFVVQYSAV